MPHICHIQPQLSNRKSATGSEQRVRSRQAQRTIRTMLGTLLSFSVLQLAHALSFADNQTTSETPATPRGLAQTLERQLAIPYGCGSIAAFPPEAPSNNMGALWLRAAFHDVGKFDPATNQPVAGLLPYFLNETEDDGIGISIATNFASRFKFPYSVADIIAFAGAVTVMHCGGPMFNMSVGRTDAPTNTSFASLPNSLPDDQVDSYQMIKQKLQRLGLSPIDMVALVTGSHSMGGAHKAISPHATNETFTPFDTTP
ncbi:heme peroxidase, partial [Chytriomyces sp. MP71]